MTDIAASGGYQAQGGATELANSALSGGTTAMSDGATGLGGSSSATSGSTEPTPSGVGGATPNTNGPSISAFWLTPPLPLRGVNLAGAEFGEGHLPGVHGIDYVYPDPLYANSYDSLSYYLKKGMTAFRLPFRWERVQPTLGQPLHPEELERLRSTVKRITDAGAFAILDLHNYARYQGKLIGSEVTNAQFADVWGRLAAEFRGNERLVLGLMNEPHTMPTEQWLSAANAAIKAIRDAGSTQLVLVPGNNWTDGNSWTSEIYGTPNSTTMSGVVDPGNNYAFEVHQYFDSDGSGTQEACVSATHGSEALQKVTEWMRGLGKKAFLGEFGASSQPVCLSAVEDLLNYIEHNTDVWLGWAWWAGGPWWGSYLMSLEPNAGQDQPQMDVLERHLSAIPVAADTSLPMDATGWISQTSNVWGMQGSWYWYSDASRGGHTTVDQLVTGDIPFVSGSGMCLNGTTTGGAVDGYVTWGAVIGLSTNRALGSDVCSPLINGPLCYRVTVAGTAPGGMRARLLAHYPMPNGLEPPGIDLSAGTTDVCVNNVAPPGWCQSSPGACADASSLVAGVAALEVQALAGANGGAIDLCVTKVVPH